MKMIKIIGFYISFLVLLIAGSLEAQSTTEMNNGNKGLCQFEPVFIGEIKALTSIARESAREINLAFDQLDKNNPGPQSPLLISIISELSKIAYQAGDLLEKIVLKLGNSLTSQETQEINTIAQTVKQTARRVDTLRGMAAVTPVITPVEIMPVQPIIESIPAPEVIIEAPVETPIIETQPTLEQPTEQPTEPSEEPAPFEDLTVAPPTPEPEPNPTAELEKEEQETLARLPFGAPTLEMVYAFGEIDTTKEDEVKKQLQSIMSDFEEKFPGIDFLSFITDIKALYNFAKASKEYHELFKQTVENNDAKLIKELHNKILQTAHEFIDKINEINDRVKSTQWYTLYGQKSNS